MTKEQLASLKVGDTVAAVVNTGTLGIQPYQYLGIFNQPVDGSAVYVFASVNFLCTIVIELDKVNSSRNVKKIFLTSNEAYLYQRELKRIDIEMQKLK